MNSRKNGIATREINLTKLLIHDEAVPPLARDALHAASFGPPSQRRAELEVAARILLSETDLDWPDTRELLGLPDASRAEFCGLGACC